MSVEVCVTIGTFVVLETNMMITLDTSSGTAIGIFIVLHNTAYYIEIVILSVNIVECDILFA